MNHCCTHTDFTNTQNKRSLINCDFFPSVGKFLSRQMSIISASDISFNSSYCRYYLSWLILIIWPFFFLPLKNDLYVLESYEITFFFKRTKRRKMKQKKRLDISLGSVSSFWYLENTMATTPMGGF